MAKDNNRFLELAQERLPALSEDLTEKFRRQARGINLKFLDELVKADLLDRNEASKMWANSINRAHIDPLTTAVSQEALDSIPMEIVKAANVFPQYIFDSVLTVCMEDPDDTVLIGRLENITHHKISAVFSLPVEIEDAIKVYYTTSQDILEQFEGIEKASRDLIANFDVDSHGSGNESHEVIELVDALFYLAIKERASDVHFEPQKKMAKIRFRVDGNLRLIAEYSIHVHNILIARLKIMAGQRIDESRFPQDGRFSLSLGANKADFRASFLPVKDGSKAVVRVLAVAVGESQEIMKLDDMYMSCGILSIFRKLIRSPNGLIFITGPTGSGKTTTLYSAIQEINDPTKNISSIEDPVEIALPNVNQAQVNSEIDLHFPDLLRAMLRQDPDVILIGEIRDLETAKIATEAALTGHLVLSTLHTNTAIQAVIRMVEIGIDPHMLAPSLLGILAQRLMAKICGACKEAYHPTPEFMTKYFGAPDRADELFIYHAPGCPLCRNTGYKGRVSFHELVFVSESLRNLIARNASNVELANEAARIGSKSLRYDALKKVFLGLTSVEEMEKHTHAEWST